MPEENLTGYIHVCLSGLRDVKVHHKENDMTCGMYALQGPYHNYM